VGANLAVRVQAVRLEWAHVDPRLAGELARLPRLAAGELAHEIRDLGEDRSDVEI
jgi:hypothetical protein